MNILRISKISKNKESILYLIFSLAIICYMLGDYFHLFGIKLSWIVTILLLICIVLIPINKEALNYKQTRKRIAIIMIIWCLYSLIVSSININISLILKFNINLFINAFLVICLLYLVRTKNDVSLVINSVLIGIGINAIIAFVQIYTKINIQNPEFNGVPTGVYGNPNDFGTVMFLGILLLMYKIIFQKNKEEKVISLMLLIIFLFLAIKSKSRTILLCILLVMPILIINSLFFRLNIIKKKKNAIIYFLVVSVSISALMLILIYNVGFANRILNILSLNNDSNTTSDFFRLSILRDMLKMFFNSFMLGVGSGVSTFLEGINPHNLFFEILVDYGIIFFLLTVLFFGYLCIYRNKDNKKSIFINSSVFLFFILSFASSSIFRIRGAWIFIFILFFIIICDNKEAVNGRNSYKKIY